VMREAEKTRVFASFACAMHNAVSCFVNGLPLV
jgi:hypothetical protein